MAVQPRDRAKLKGLMTTQARPSRAALEREGREDRRYERDSMYNWWDVRRKVIKHW